MNAKKRPPSDPFDPSLHPTRKVEAMSSIAAELLLQDQESSFDEASGRRRRFERPLAGGDAPWPPLRPGAVAPTRSSAPPPPSAPVRSGPRAAILVLAALLLVAVSVSATLLLTR